MVGSEDISIRLHAFVKQCLIKANVLLHRYGQPGVSILPKRMLNDGLR